MDELYKMNIQILEERALYSKKKTTINNLIKIIKHDTIFEQMLSKYQFNTEQEKKNAIYEVMQQITLAGLFRDVFFDHAAFYGGTCLRIFYKMERFSENLDFSLLQNDEEFKLEDYFPAIIEEFKLVGRDVVITKKEKQNFGKGESAFLKNNTSVYDIAFQTEKSLKIKIEVDTQPSLKFETEQKLLLQPISFLTRCYTLPNLFAVKMHTLVFRNWKNRVKGRDWYDFEWYVRKDVALDFTHLKERVKEFNDMDIGKEEFVSLLKEN